MKKIAFPLLIVILVSSLSACGSHLKAAKVISVIDAHNGRTITVGDTEKSLHRKISKVVISTSEDESVGADIFEFQNAAGVSFDILRSDKTVSGFTLRHDSRWEIASGIRIGSTRDEILDAYKNNNFVVGGAKGGVYLAYDENLLPIEYREDAPYRVTILFSDNIADYISVTKHLTPISADK